MAPSRKTRLANLALGNEARARHAALKTDLREGDVTVAEALVDPRGATLALSKLLVQAPGWGQRRVSEALDGLMIDHYRATGRLTDRQRERIVAVFEAGPQRIDDALLAVGAFA